MKGRSLDGSEEKIIEETGKLQVFLQNYADIHEKITADAELDEIPGVAPFPLIQNDSGGNAESDINEVAKKKKTASQRGRGYTDSGEEQEKHKRTHVCSHVCPSSPLPVSP